MTELQPGEFEIQRYGAWWANVRRVDPKLGSGPLWFWRMGHDDAGTLADGRGLSLDEACDQATVALKQFSGRVAS